ncbi:hypothetical protein [Paenibacillus alkalitolerans]|uniref:hypothetical protein n=1 Tax=Paenibacillus alkalitolerans TaxID=2799335 RepID=UPI0018F49C59|nr:hypothetical protein [Paenibacillus alkalitolerans]
MTRKRAREEELNALKEIAETLNVSNEMHLRPTRICRRPSRGAIRRRCVRTAAGAWTNIGAVSWTKR